MSNDRVSDGDKRRARQIVDQGLASGRIIEADRDKRIEQIDNAQSVDELRMLTHDLDRSAMFGGTIEAPSPMAPPPPPAQMPSRPAAPPVSAPAPPVAPMPGLTPMFGAPAGATPPGQPGMSVPYGPPGGISAESLAQIEASMGAAAKKSGRGCLGCLIPLIVVLAVFGGTGFFVYNDVSDAIKDAFESSSNNPGPGSAPENEPPDVLTVDGWNDLKAAVQTATGSTELFTLVLYPDYASITAPAEATGNHTETYFWDGDLNNSNVQSTSQGERFDMDDIRAAVLPRLVAKARKTVDDPSSWYAIVQAPDFEGASIMAYAVNDFGDTVYIAATADGRIVRRYDSTDPLG